MYTFSVCLDTRLRTTVKHNHNGQKQLFLAFVTVQGDFGFTVIFHYVFKYAIILQQGKANLVNLFMKHDSNWDYEIEKCII